MKDRIVAKLSDAQHEGVLTAARESMSGYLSDGLTRFAVSVILFVLLLAMFGPMVTPYDYDERLRGDDGGYKVLEPPSAEHWLGTTNNGEDVFSRLVYGARPSMAIGLLAGGLSVSIGLLIGVTSGYFGGRVDAVLMRFTDAAYVVPFIPLAIVRIAFFGIDFWTTIILIGLVLWRESARIFRSQVLQLKERSYVRSTEALGGGDLYIIKNHILPNMGGMVVLFFALAVGISILIAASLAFLGLINPFVPSWGVILRNVYDSGTLSTSLWWSLPPGFMIAMTVLATFLLGRGYERIQATEIETTTE